MKKTFLVILIGILEAVPSAFGGEATTSKMFANYIDCFQAFDPLNPAFGRDPTRTDFSPNTAVTFWQATWSPTEILDFRKVRVRDILDLYQGTSGLDLVIDSRVPVDTLVTVKTAFPVTASETQKLVEHALISQAGVIITRLDDKRASVTFNDQLTIKPLN